MSNQKIKRIVWAGLFIALTTVATLVTIPMPMTNGYVNAGDALVILGAFLLGPGWGALAAGLGAALADVFLGFFIYAPATLVIKGLMALVAGVLISRAKKKRKLVPAIFGAVLAEIIMVGGYFLYEWILYGFGGAVGSLVGNGTQAVFGAAAGIALYFALTRINYVRDNF